MVLTGAMDPDGVHLHDNANAGRVNVEWVTGDPLKVRPFSSTGSSFFIVFPNFHFLSEVRGLQAPRSSGLKLRASPKSTLIKQ